MKSKAFKIILLAILILSGIFGTVVLIKQRQAIISRALNLDQPTTTPTAAIKFYEEEDFGTQDNILADAGGAGEPSPTPTATIIPLATVTNTPTPTPTATLVLSSPTPTSAPVPVTATTTPTLYLIILGSLGLVLGSILLWLNPRSARPGL